MHQSEAVVKDSDQAHLKIETKEACLALAFEISKRASLQKNFSQFCLFLVNDLRAFVEFDRCFIAFHIGGPSRVIATNHQPTVEKKSESYSRMNDLALGIKDLNKGLLISCQDAECNFEGHGISDGVQSAVSAYTQFSKSCYFLSVPLTDGDKPIAHLVCEFFGDEAPSRLNVMALIESGPLITRVLSEKWMLQQKPSMGKLMNPDTPMESGFARLGGRTWTVVTFFIALVTFLLFLFPINHTVGGEAAVVPWERYFAFSRIDGLIDRVFVKEGGVVGKGDILASLDTKEIQLKMSKAEREIEIIDKQIQRLTLEADKTPSKLGEVKILELERLKKREELKFLKWQSQFLDITSPVNGIITTKDVESLSGKKISAGDPFCEIAQHSELGAEILVPDYRAALVKKGQPVRIYLNNDPVKGYQSSVSEIAPTAEVVPRQGNVCRVKARFPSIPESVMVGMTGIGKIETQQTNLWSIIVDSLMLKLNEFYLYL